MNLHFFVLFKEYNLFICFLKSCKEMFLAVELGILENFKTRLFEHILALQEQEIKNIQFSNVTPCKPWKRGSKR